MLAAVTQTPELALNDDEAKRLAGALHEVTKHYSIPVMNPHHMALAMLFWCSGSIYLPRAKAIAARKAGGQAAQAADAQAAQQTPQPQATGNVIQPAAWFDLPGVPAH